MITKEQPKQMKVTITYDGDTMYSHYVTCDRSLMEHTKSQIQNNVSLAELTWQYIQSHKED